MRFYFFSESGSLQRDVEKLQEIVDFALKANDSEQPKKWQGIPGGCGILSNLLGTTSF